MAAEEDEQNTFFFERIDKLFWTFVLYVLFRIRQKAYLLKTFDI